MTVVTCVYFTCLTFLLQLSDLLTLPVECFCSVDHLCLHYLFANCQICHRGFKQSGSLKFHMKSYHNLDIALSQGLEARFQQSRTRSALRHQSTAGLVVSTQNTPSAGGVQPTLMGAGESSLT